MELVFDIIRTAGWLVGTILHGILFAVLLDSSFAISEEQESWFD